MIEDSKKFCDLLIAALEDKKAIDPEIVDVSEDSSIADAFIITSGNSDTHMNTLLRAADETLISQGLQPKIEGENSTQWILIDGGDVIVHIFSVKAREYYSIEKIYEGLKAARQSQ